MLRAVRNSSRLWRRMMAANAGPSPVAARRASCRSSSAWARSGARDSAGCMVSSAPFDGVRGGGVPASEKGLSALQPQDAPGGAVGQQIEPAVGALAHVADALLQVGEQAFLASDLAAIEREAHQHLRAQCTDEQAAFPSGVTVAGEKRH